MSFVGSYVRATRTGALALCLVGGLCVASSADAGVLNGHLNAFTDVANITWTSSTPFDNGTGLSGFIDWAVFGPGDFPFAGYTPTAGELTYAYQVFSTGSAAIHAFTLNLNNPANNIGSFGDVAGAVPTSATLGAQAVWNFAGLDIGQNSSGLAFSSANVPSNFFGILINGGTTSVAFPLPVPSPNNIPEPASLALMAIGGLLMLRRQG